MMTGRLWRAASWLVFEGVKLHVTRAVVPMVVQADFADRHVVSRRKQRVQLSMLRARLRRAVGVHPAAA